MLRLCSEPTQHSSIGAPEGRALQRDSSCSIVLYWNGVREEVDFDCALQVAIYLELNAVRLPPSSGRVQWLRTPQQLTEGRNQSMFCGG